ncbi:MAG: tannase/feruloyl esterase family alpha/beta hydrolase [Betaproteobacteria bacterium]|jgi:pimeloyl-ACP methyl ester carboxylesterase|nr:tannase/feruloyl esterase family alpha/beta hydrolase [Betaproteobacteria bacterium]
MRHHTISVPLLLASLWCTGFAAWGQTTDCLGFAAQAPAGVSLSLEQIAGDSVRPPNVTAGPLLAAHCKLSGRMAERIGQDGKPYHIGFEMRLPTQWNGRLLYQGGGGNDGVVRPAVGPQAAPGYALNRGFAVVTTDAGHQGPTANFGFDPIARTDNAYNAHDKVAVTAKELIKRYYAKPADRSYFIGCSGGGRQAMMFTQRFPSYFDGVIAMAPAMRVSKGATIAAAWDTQALQAIAPVGEDGKPVLSKALSDSDLGLIRKGILDSCDAQDGVVDGLVSNPAACKFEVSTLQCTGAKTDSCLAPAQVGALKKMFSGARDSAGKPLYTTWPWDPGMGHQQNDWRGWKLGNALSSKANSRHVFLMEDALQGYFVTPPDRSLSIYQFDFDRDPQRMDAHAWIFNTADDVKLTGFQARGGKLLFIHGMADPIFSAHEMEDYYQRLTAENGAKTPDFSRLFLVPGMGHCQGGAATDSIDGLGALVDWVENGKAPDTLNAKGTTVYPGRTRPLCAYPKYAHYKGTGTAEDAANFSCR